MDNVLTVADRNEDDKMIRKSKQLENNIKHNTHEFAFQF